MRGVTLPNLFRGEGDHSMESLLIWGGEIILEEIPSTFYYRRPSKGQHHH
jgi:hypothetical protein